MIWINNIISIEDTSILVWDADAAEVILISEFNSIACYNLHITLCSYYPKVFFDDVILVCGL